MSMMKKKWPKAYRQRCESMFNNDILSDVKFVVRASQYGDCSESKRSKMVIPAHKFLLSIRSPVFFAMFCGKMAETKEDVDLPDCEYEGMFELLRYIYTDKVCLTGSNVMQVAYLSAKYMIPCLAKECATYLGRNLDSSNVFGILKQAQQFANKVLEQYCWDLIDRMTKDVLKSSEFLTIERCLLQELVERDTLNIREVGLFKAIDCWGEKECKRQNLRSDGPAKRQILGEQIIKKLRFPVMKQSEFMDVVVDTKILTQEETSNVVLKFLGSTVKSPNGFLEMEREGSLLRCCRYHNYHRVVGYSIDSSFFNPVPLTVDKDIVLHGVSFWAMESELYATITVTINVYLGTSLLLLSETESADVLKKESAFCTYHGFDILFENAVAMKKNVQYCVAIAIDLPAAEFFYGYDHDFVSIYCGGVTFNFGKGDTAIAEFLFQKVDETQ